MAIQSFIEEMRRAPLVLNKWQDSLWNLLVQKMDVAADGTVTFTFRGENTITVRIG